ncbi:MAG: hypothetical protein LBG59_04795 [Candidatus Peribacteria bacterium]|nr:hypothetical protein [Candidatus Peribacteria bacterium]
MKRGKHVKKPGEAEGTIVAVVRVHVGRIQVQTTGGRAIRTRRPVAAAVPLTVDRSRRIVITVTS